MRPAIIVTFISVLLASAKAEAQDPGIGIELNRLETREEGCRAYLVLENGREARFESLRLDLVLFDPEGIINRRLAVEAGPLAAGKTLVKLFDIRGLECGRVGRVLLNGVLACETPAGPAGGCVDMISVSARTGTPFVK